MIQKILSIGYVTFLKAVVIFGIITVVIFGLNFYGIIKSIQLGNYLTLPFSICGIISFICYAICLFFTKDRTAIQKNMVLTIAGFIAAFIFLIFMVTTLMGIFGCDIEC